MEESSQLDLPAMFFSPIYELIFYVYAFELLHAPISLSVFICWNFIG